MRSKLKTIGYALILVMWFFATQYMVSTLFMTIEKLGLLKDGFAKNHTFLLTFFSYLLCIGGILAAENKEGDSTLKEYRKTSYKEVRKYLLVGVLIWLSSSVLNALLLPFFPTYQVEIDTLFNESEMLMRFIVLVIGAPLVEEFIFRGKVQTLLKRKFNGTVAAVVQGIVFGLIHPFGLQKIYASFMGIAFGFVKEKTNNLYASTAMHMLINFIGWLVGMLTYYMSI